MGKLPPGFKPFGKGGKPATGAASIPPAEMKKGIARDKAMDKAAGIKEGSAADKKKDAKVPGYPMGKKK